MVEHQRSAAEDLLGGDVERGSMRAKLANAMVGLKAKYYGRGPEAAKAYIDDEHVFVVLEGGLTRNEETLLSAGKQDLVRNYRLAFQESMTETTCGAVQEITGRKVMGYHSQIVFDPPRSLEWFVLEAPPGD
ncbi:Na-translocating system protein MpsC family protein [Conexibacter sp. SYSU D00693]|uniref:Na-translocating system protein MpsC family protein n=1 Tax=Conexibacter sp. SYSU D00693 TaxID=2812560 RepID=UPI00196A7A05|nr:Na-translocating system protein MpsC family protein [Conexibacter sp. SYSU D00693]